MTDDRFFCWLILLAVKIGQLYRSSDITLITVSLTVYLICAMTVTLRVKSKTVVIYHLTQS